MTDVDPVAAIKHSHSTQNIPQLGIYTRARIPLYILYILIIIYFFLILRGIKTLKDLCVLLSLILKTTTKPVLKSGVAYDQA